ncbi:hypothetical protein VP01_1050g7 [Puccinia sorghi]|uniref:Uncharacterized protein n=1 Tax=Puccinia sorghi TaxID=27349 RepID=A0A0L6VU59_9BASI|nr:hypothetical protein VP01_1050g7 [Puccinia sorghi]
MFQGLSLSLSRVPHLRWGVFPSLLRWKRLRFFFYIPDPDCGLAIPDPVPPDRNLTRMRASKTQEKKQQIERNTWDILAWVSTQLVGNELHELFRFNHICANFGLTGATQMILAADGGGILRKRIADEKCGLVENGEMGGVITSGFQAECFNLGLSCRCRNLLIRRFRTRMTPIRNPWARSFKIRAAGSAHQPLTATRRCARTMPRYSYDYYYYYYARKKKGGGGCICKSRREWKCTKDETGRGITEGMCIMLLMFMESLEISKDDDKKKVTCVDRFTGRIQDVNAKQATKERTEVVMEDLNQATFGFGNKKMKKKRAVKEVKKCVKHEKKEKKKKRQKE